MLVPPAVKEMNETRLWLPAWARNALVFLLERRITPRGHAGILGCVPVRRTCAVRRAPWPRRCFNQPFGASHDTLPILCLANLVSARTPISNI